MKVEKKEKYLRETDIRDDALVAEMESCYQRDLARLTAINNEGKLYQHCLSCRYDEFLAFGEKHGNSFSECRNCGLVFVNPRATNENLLHYYATSEHYQFYRDYIFPQSKEVRNTRIHHPRAQKLLKQIWAARGRIEPIKILDFGAGDGGFCRALSTIYEAKGWVPSDYIYAFDPGVNQQEPSCFSRISRWEDLAPGFELVTAIEVLEHVADPNDCLRDIRYVLTGDGYFYLTVPNLDSLVLRGSGLRGRFFNNEHITYFNRTSLVCLLNKSFFRVIEFETPGLLDVDILKKLNSDGRLDSIYSNLIERIPDTTISSFQELIVDIKLSSHMAVLSRVSQ